MKKILLSTAVLLLCSLAHSQEADGSDKSAEFQIIPRFDFAPYAATGGDASSGIGFGSSSIYTLFEGSLSEHFSFTFSNHWLSTEPADLYAHTFRSDWNNWVDVALADFNFGAFEFALGKDAILTGGMEFDSWDVDVDDILASELWNTVSCYQWGARVGLNLPSGASSFHLQACSSPYGEHPFTSGLFCYSAMWTGSFGPLDTRWTVSAVERQKSRFDYLATLGQTLSLDTWTFELDWYNTMGAGDYNILGGNTFRFCAEYAPSQKWEIALKGNYYLSNRVSETVTGLCGGLSLHYYPLKDNRALRLHAIAAYDSLAGCASASLGVKVNFTIFKK